jgi:hypothetical protein
LALEAAANGARRLALSSVRSPKLNLLVRSRTEAIHSQERRPATGGLQDVRRIIQKNATEIDSYEEDFEALPWSVVG